MVDPVVWLLLSATLKSFRVPSVGAIFLGLCLKHGFEGKFFFPKDLRPSHFQHYSFGIISLLT